MKTPGYCCWILFIAWRFQHKNCDNLGLGCRRELFTNTEFSHISRIPPALCLKGDFALKDFFFSSLHTDSEISEIALATFHQSFFFPFSFFICISTQKLRPICPMKEIHVSKGKLPHHKLCSAAFVLIKKKEKRRSLHVAFIKAVVTKNRAQTWDLKYVDDSSFALDWQLWYIPLHWGLWQVKVQLFSAS